MTGQRWSEAGDELTIACLAPPLPAESCRALEALNPQREPWKTPWLLRTAGNKKADAAGHPGVPNRVGLLVNGPALMAMPFI